MKASLSIFTVLLWGAVHADTLEKDRQAILGSTGCYMVDYNYHEVEAIDPTYKLDPREYHSSINSDFQKFFKMYSMIDPAVTPDKYQLTVKEKIYARVDSPNTIHLQHIIFLTNKDGQLDFVMKHHSERWKYEAAKTYSFVGQGRWDATAVENSKGKWTREMMALDDSPRYSCTAAWDHTREYPTWTCANYSPIAGREYRDMKRSDYQALNRIHEVTVYPNAWLDTQNNEKVIEKEDGTRVAFVKEKGRNWYTRLKNDDCNVIDSFIAERKGFWDITQQVWDGLLNEGKQISEPHGAPLWLSLNGGPFIVHPGRQMVQYKKGLEEKYVTASKDKQIDAKFKAEIADEVRKIVNQ
ncbi:MAG: hypothetical protein J0L93_08200 [Deltaproteobacteria bacterium]|nr:hypothetical protein [Deltaproteobacteria bacterium]